jgi:hypothetical protein
MGGLLRPSNLGRSARTSRSRPKPSAMSAHARAGNTFLSVSSAVFSDSVLSTTAVGEAEGLIEGRGEEMRIVPAFVDVVDVSLPSWLLVSPPLSVWS